MNMRGFSNANNPVFCCSSSVLLVPFGRRSYVPAIVERYGGDEILFDETTDRIAFDLREGAASVTLLYSGMGGPAVANALEMAAANGAETVVIFGACGGTAPSIAVGDLIVVTGAVRGEGASRYYAPPGFPALFDLDVTGQLWSACRRAGMPAHRGVVYTTDAGYRQGPEVYEDCAGLIIGVESECAAAAVVAARIGLTIGAILFCTDNTTRNDAEERKYRGLKSEAVKQGFARGLDIAMQVLVGSPKTR